MGDIRAIILQEIALDGLDGLTTETLWYRLSKLPNRFPLALDKNSKNYIWKNAIVPLGEIEFYLLEDPRETPKDKILELSDVNVPIYSPLGLLSICPCKAIEDGNILGSCSTYYTRQNISERIRDDATGDCLKSYEDIRELYGNRLVIVGSHFIREKYLLQDSPDPKWARSKLTKDIYCFLELVGRMRYEGLSGSDGLAHIVQSNSKVNHGTMGYMRGKLVKYGIVTKRSTAFMKPGHSGQRFTADSVSFLKRFYRPSDQLFDQMQHKLEELLLTAPNKCAPVIVISKIIGFDRKKIVRYCNYRKPFYTTRMEPTSEMKYWEDFLHTAMGGKASSAVDLAAEDEADEATSLGGDAPPESESAAKKRKHSTVLRRRLFITLKLTQAEFEAQEETKDMESESLDPTHTAEPRCPRSSDVPFIVQIRDYLDECGPAGMSKAMMRQHFGLHTLQIRQVVNALKRDPKVVTFYVDKARQKIERIAARHLYEASQTSGPGTPVLPVNSEAEKLSQPEKPASPSPRPSKNVKVDRRSNTAQSITEKARRREASILGMIETNHIILLSDLYARITKEEENEYSTMMDRKTLRRMCTRLLDEKKLTKHNITIEVGKRRRDLEYVCRYDMKPDDQLLLSHVDQAKSELVSAAYNQIQREKHRKSKTAKQEPLTPTDSTSAILNNQPSTSTSKHKTSKLKPEKPEDMVALYKVYGYAAKLKRVDILHTFLSYVMYNYEGEAPDSSITSSPTADYDHLPVYHDSMTWKRFLGPDLLGNSASGVVRVAQLSPELPLVTFLSLVKVVYREEVIVAYMSDPLKRLVPVKHLPMEIQATLLHQRKHASYLRDVLYHLIIFGLGSNVTPFVGDTCPDTIDLTNLYLHKTVCCKDTSVLTSLEEAPAAAPLPPFAIHKSMYQVEIFWITVRQICATSPVPGKGTKLPNNYRSPDLFRRPHIRQIIKPVKIDNVVEGVIPGNGLGAAGFDSYVFSHLNRHWVSAYEKMVPNPRAATSAKKKNLTGPQRIEELVNQSTHTVVRSEEIPTSSVKSKRSKSSPPKRRSFFPPEPKASQTRTGKPKLSKEEIKAMRREKNLKEKQRDPTDVAAVSSLTTMRSYYSEPEVVLLLLCQIGLDILGVKEPAKAHVRDTLHKYLPQSKDKSARSCWARLKRQCKNGRKRLTLDLYTKLALVDLDIAKYKNTKAKYGTKEFDSAYHGLIAMLIQKYGYTSLDSYTQDSMDLHDYDGIQDLETKFAFMEVSQEEDLPETINKRFGCQFQLISHEWLEPKTDREIAEFTIFNFMFGFLLLGSKTSCHYQVHKVCMTCLPGSSPSDLSQFGKNKVMSQYPEYWCESVLQRLIRQKVARLERNNSNVRNVRECILSHRYKLFCDKIQFVDKINYSSAGHVLTSMIEGTPQQSLSNLKEFDARGALMFLPPLLASGSVDLSFDIPERVVDTSGIIEDTIVNPEDEEADLESDESIAEKISSRFEHCKIKPCQVSCEINKEKVPDMFRVKPSEDRKLLKLLCPNLPVNLNVQEELDNLYLEHPDQRDDLRILYDRIKEAGSQGLKESLLLERGLLCRPLQLLRESEVIVRVGVNENVYVAYPHARIWTIRTLRDTKGRGTGLQLTSSDTILQSAEQRSAEANAVEVKSAATSPQQSTADNISTQHVLDSENESADLDGAKGSSVPSLTTSAYSSAPSPTSTYSRAPTSTYSRAPTSTYSRAPTSTYSRVPTSTYSRAPTSTYSRVPTSTYSRAPTSTYSRAPTSTYSRAPTSTYSRAPTSTYSRAPTSTYSRAPTSTYSRAPTSTYSRVDMIPHPWMTPEGRPNYDILYNMLTAVLSNLSHLQGTLLPALTDRFSMCYSNVSVLSILEVLEEIGCINKVYLQQPARYKVKLFSKRPSISVSREPIRSSDTITDTHYIVTNNAFVRLGQFINNTNLKRKT